MCLYCYVCVLLWLDETHVQDTYIDTNRYLSSLDADQGCLDQLVFELMIPIAKLKKYVQLVSGRHIYLSFVIDQTSYIPIHWCGFSQQIEQHKTLMIHGAQGSGKDSLDYQLSRVPEAQTWCRRHSGGSCLSPPKFPER